MNKLVEYIKSCDLILYKDELYDNFSNFGYDMIDELEDDLIFLLETLYPEYILYNSKRERLEQIKFRKDLLKKYNKCIITNTSCEAQLEAAHIIPFCENINNNYIENGLLLTSNLHKTFDKYYWAINPDTMLIEIKNNIDVGDIIQYKGTKINLECNNIMRSNLQKRYDIFIEQNII